MNSAGLRLCLVIGLLAISQGCASNQRAPEGTGAAGVQFDPAKGTALIAGKVLFEGSAPEPVALKLTADPACAAMHQDPLHSEEVLVKDGRLRNAFVWVKQGLEKYSFATPTEPVVLKQDGCRYSPHVGGLMVNQKLRIVNADPTLHNIHCMAQSNAQFNIGQAVQGMSAERSFPSPEVMVRFKCDVHNWMTCYFGVVPHPYFSVTGPDGTYALKGLPAGEYVIEAWHEKFGAKRQKIGVQENQSAAVDFSFGADI